MEGLPFVGPTGERLRGALLVVVILLGVFLGLKSLTELHGLQYIGAGVAATNTITVEGKGEVLAVPDVAEFSFSVVSLKQTVALAQEEATKKVNEITTYIKDQGVAERDIKTINYSVYPQYEWEQIVCITYPCPGGRQMLKGYEVRQTTQVKARDIDKAGELLTGVGSRGASEVSGLTLTVDDEEAVKREARGKAIVDAREKATELSKALGVRLVRVVSFYESGGSPPIIYDRLGLGMRGAEPAKAPAPEISPGENKIVSNVSITYEIR